MAGKEPLFERFGLKLSEKVEKAMPDPLIFAILLTIITWILAIVLMRPYEKMDAVATIQWLFEAWYKGFWELLAFAMQMALILVTGYAIAFHPIIYRGLKRLASLPKSTKSAAALTALISLLAAWIHWGLSLIIGALLARAIGLEFYRNKRTLHYPAIVASAYAGLGLNWHWGLSASAPLVSNTPGHFLAKVYKELYGVETIPLSETIFHPYCLINMIIIILFGVLAFYAIAPKNVSKGIEVVAPQMIEIAEKEEREAKVKTEAKTLADKLENSKILALLVAIPAMVTMWFWFSRLGFFRGLDLNSLNFIFILAGFLIYLNPIAYMRAITRAAGAVAGILIQFPFYAGIMGLMRYTLVDGVNLAMVLSNAIAQVATPTTWPAICLYLSGFINIFIPSGGGEWAAIGEIITRTSHQLGVPLGKSIIAYAAGDAWTNLFQPFWAIPLLGLTGTRARDVFGYTIAVMILATIPFSLGLVLVPY